jgi:tRNA modification GTPase
MNYSDDTIAAISTPVGEGGIGIVRVSGTRAIQVADRIFAAKSGRALAACDSHTVHYGRIISRGAENVPHGDTPSHIIDEVLVTMMRAPRTYTREDVVEINCHGGMQALSGVLDLCVKNGARIAEPGEFTKRAFLNGRIDLVQAEAVLDMIRAKTESSLKVAASQLEGGLSEKINDLRDKVIGIAAHIEASIDFPEEELDIITDRTKEDVDDILRELKHLIDTAPEGMILREGVLAVICGKPNAGKSSLMNLLLKRDRVIVTPVPGTTRDAVEEMINLKGIPIRLVDTAGIGQTDDVVEKEGIKRSKGYLEKAEIALLVFDGATKLDKEDRDIIKLLENKKKLVIINKIDLPKKLVDSELRQLFKGEVIVEISVEHRTNIDILEKAIVDAVWRGHIHQGESIVVANSRHKALLDNAYRNMTAVKTLIVKGDWPELVAVDLKEAIYNLGLVVGKSVSDDILNRIFERFCIGK